MFPALRSSLSAAPLALLLVYSAGRYGADLTEIQIHWWNDLFWTSESLIVGLACFQVYRNNESENRAWLFFALGHLAFFAAMLVWSFYEVVLGQLNPFPSPADIGFLATALFFALGVSTSGSLSGRSLFWGFTVSKVAVVATGTLLIAAIWLADAVVEAQTDWLYTTVALAWTVGFSTVFVYGCVAFWTKQLAARDWAAVLVVAALGMHAFVSILYTEALLRNAYEVGSWFDILWLFGFTLFWWAALEHERTAREAADEEEISGEIIDRIGVADSLVTSVFILGTFGAVVSSEATPEYLDNLVLVLGTLFAAAIAWRGWEFYRASTRAAAERESLVARLREATATAEAANSAKDDFLSAMSHEIRTPLTGLLGVVDILKMEPLTQKQQDYVHAVRGSGRHLLNVINDILDFSRIEAGYLQLEQMDFSLLTVLERLRSLVHPLAIEHGLELRFELSEHSPPVLKGDPTRLKQVLINLVGNAIKFTEKGSVTLTVSSATDQDGQLRFRFEVRDTGTGIAPERQAELFSAFMQADRSIARRFGGSGLGLAISQRLVNAMGGEIEVNSAPGLGSLFWFEVPFELGDPANLESERAFPFADVQPRRILIAEDVKLNQDILQGNRISEQAEQAREECIVPACPLEFPLQGFL
ncbi:ATP-binding protein [Aurantimonas sp. A2-1-M11]|uniref:hybrid sensor histidine kinase/response regulator n=1 Tax=Aurantimonas sp. A2-1-M11 TaxID=3113712 RepID=UPI002F94D1CE